ncbi:MAG: hypothetical protein GVY11_01270 [Gammaproteobacteria bacterium]|jgi:uncharacterized coiled-coil protein SlyX|nr:hypothetical protein [Gammaproteobacteria bacterium]
MSAAYFFGQGVSQVVKEALNQTDAYPRWLQGLFTVGIGLACMMLWNIGSDVTNGVERATAELSTLNQTVDRLSDRLERIADRQKSSVSLINTQAQNIGVLEERVANQGKVIDGLRAELRQIRTPQ